MPGGGLHMLPLQRTFPAVVAGVAFVVSCTVNGGPGSLAAARQAARSTSCRPLLVSLAVGCCPLPFAHIRYSHTKWCFALPRVRLRKPDPLPARPRLHPALPPLAPPSPPLQDLLGFVLVNVGTLLGCISLFLLILLTLRMHKVI